LNCVRGRTKSGWIAACLVCIACETRTIEHAGSEAEVRYAEDAAAAYCETILACGCPEHWVSYADETACIEEQASYIAEVQRRAQEAGLRFDPECAAFTIERWRDLGCDDRVAASERLRPGESGLFPYCRLYFGTVPEGEQCETAFATVWNDCESGTTCEDGARGSRCTRIDPVFTEVPGLGEACFAGEPAARWSCEAPLYCAGEPGSATCQPIAAEGESCDGRPCVEGLRCDLGNTFTCKNPLPDGAACSSLDYLGCIDGFFCDSGGLADPTGTCRPQLPPGSACQQYEACRDGECDCSGEESCDGVCVAEEEPSIPTPYPFLCEPGPVSPTEMF
jgi:hypothetical protein